MKPMPSDYNLPQGVYLFLGYSEVDERELNRNHTIIVIQDVVRVLQHILEEEAVNGVSDFYNDSLFFNMHYKYEYRNNDEQKIKTKKLTKLLRTLEQFQNIVVFNK